MQDQVVVTVWNHRSETSYTFGPMSPESVDDFTAGLPEHIQPTGCSVLNDPALAGSGNETEFEHPVFF